MNKAQLELERTFRAIIDEEGGGAQVGGEPFVLIPRASLSDIQKEMETILGRGVEGILVRAGHQRGREFATRLTTLVGEREDAFQEGLRVFASRTGLFRLQGMATEGTKTTVTVTDSIVGANYGKARTAVCHYIRGFVLAAIESVRHQRDLICKEVRCASMGDEVCMFEVTPFFGESNEPREQSG